MQVVVPRTFAEFTTRRVLTSSWLEGEKLSGSTASDVGDLVNLGVICYLKQLLDTGFFHVSLLLVSLFCILFCSSHLILSCDLAAVVDVDVVAVAVAANLGDPPCYAVLSFDMSHSFFSVGAVILHPSFAQRRPLPSSSSAAWLRQSHMATVSHVYKCITAALHVLSKKPVPVFCASVCLFFAPTFVLHTVLHRKLVVTIHTVMCVISHSVFALYACV